MTSISNLNKIETLIDEKINNFPYDEDVPERKKESGVQFVTLKEQKNGELKPVYDHVGHATSLIKEFTFLRNKYDFCYYDHSTGIWKSDGVSFAKKIIVQRLGKYAKENWLRECYSYIYHSVYNENLEWKFESNPHLINVENGVVDLKTGELLPFNPYFMQRVKVPHKYIENAECPGISNFITDIVDKEQVRFVFEWIGYSLLKDYRMRKILLTVGEGKNGKSKLIELISKLVGERNVSNVSLHDLQHHKFALAELDGKLINACADIDSEFFNSIDKVKGLSGGDALMIERKNGQPYSFINYAKLMFSCNTLPTFRDKTFAIKDRFIVLPFENQFIGKDRNDNILEEISTEEEMQGLLFEAIQAIRHVLEVGEFSISTRMERATQEWFDEMDKIKAFVDDCCVISEDAFVINKELYSAFATFCKENGYSPGGSTTFYKQVEEKYPEVYRHTKKVSINNGRKDVTYFKNIGLLIG